MKHTDTVWEKAEFLDVVAGGVYTTYLWALNGSYEAITTDFLDTDFWIY